MELRNGLLIAFGAVLVLIALFSGSRESVTVGGMASVSTTSLQFRCVDPDSRNAYMGTSVHTYDLVTGEERGSLPDRCRDSNNLNEAVCQSNGVAKYVPKYCVKGCDFQRNVCKS